MHINGCFPGKEWKAVCKANQSTLYAGMYTVRIYSDTGQLSQLIGSVSLDEARQLSHFLAHHPAQPGTLEGFPEVPADFSLSPTRQAFLVENLF